MHNVFRTSTLASLGAGEAHSNPQLSFFLFSYDFSHDYRNDDGVIDSDDDEIAAFPGEAELAAFDDAFHEENLPPGPLLLNEILTGLDDDTLGFYLKGTTHQPSVVFLRSLLKLLGKSPNRKRDLVLHPHFDGYGDSMVKVTHLVNTPAIKLFSLFGGRDLPLILMEWKLASSSFCQTLLNFFEDASTNGKRLFISSITVIFCNIQ
jgi:hypothetical protein